MLSNCKIVKKERKKTPEKVMEKYGEAPYFDEVKMVCKGRNGDFDASMDVGMKRGEKFADLNIDGRILKLRGRAAEIITEDI